jgi:hypothetical protein
MNQKKLFGRALVAQSLEQVYFTSETQDLILTKGSCEKSP